MTDLTDDELDTEIALLEQQILECSQEIEEAADDDSPTGPKGPRWPRLIFRLRDLENQLKALQQAKLERAAQPVASKTFDARNYWANLAAKASPTPEKTEQLRKGYKRSL